MKQNKKQLFLTSGGGLYLISFLLLLSIGIFSIYQYVNWVNSTRKGIQQLKEQYGCYSDNISEEMLYQCQRLERMEEKYTKEMDSTQNLFFTLSRDYSLNNILFFLILFVMIPSTYYFHKVIHSGFLKNQFMRMSYQKFLKKNLGDCYKAAFLLPSAFLIIFFVCFLVCRHFDLNVGHLNLIFDESYMTNPIFYITYFLNLFLHSIFYINIGLINIKKYKNFFVCILSSFFTFFACEIAFSVILGSFVLDKWLRIGNMYDTLSLLNIFDYYGLKNYYDYFIFSFLLAGLSTFLVYLSYRKKEKVVLESEV